MWAFMAWSITSWFVGSISPPLGGSLCWFSMSARMMFNSGNGRLKPLTNLPFSNLEMSMLRTGGQRVGCGGNTTICPVCNRQGSPGMPFNVNLPLP